MSNGFHFAPCTVIHLRNLCIFQKDCKVAVGTEDDEIEIQLLLHSQFEELSIVSTEVESRYWARIAWSYQ